MFSRSSDVTLLALVATVVAAFVIVLLAFFFTFPSRGPYVINGVPNDEETSRVTFTQRNGYSERLDTSTRRQDQRPEVVGENRLPSVAIPD